MTPTNSNEVNHHGTRTGSSDLCGAEVRVCESAGEAGSNLLAIGRASGPEETAVSDVPSGAPTRGEARQGGGHSVDAAGGVAGTPRWTQERRNVAARGLIDTPLTYVSADSDGAWEQLLDVYCQRNELLDGCNALLGLIDLLSHNPDVPQYVKDLLLMSHRKAEAEAAVAKAVSNV